MDSDDIWMDETSGNIEDFRRLLSRRTDPADYPFADRVENNVPIYSGDRIRAIGSNRRALMSEWVRIFKDGPGIVMFENAYADAGIVDQATDVFEGLIESEKAEGLGGGDHFAKPGTNDRVWNALEKHCVADPENYVRYYSNVAIAMVSEAWLGAPYQVTAQVNRVNPGGQAQSAHRDYHLGFMSPADAAGYPMHIHELSPALTLQGAVAHVDMPLESGPTLYLPYSQLFPEGYVAFPRPEFQDYFTDHHVQMPLKKGDAVFFNPALMHAAGNNVSKDIYRLANLMQVSSGFGRAIETVDRTRTSKTAYTALKSLSANQTLSAEEVEAAIAATAEGYPFPTNLDRDPPVAGLAPKSQRSYLREALADGMAADEFARLMDDLATRKRSH